MSAYLIDADVTISALKGWLEVYDGLSAEDMAEVEAIALDRSR